MSNVLKAITLRNFKGVRDPVRIELKPITLLFGPNSAGKSTILQALHYLREVLERGNLDPDTTLGGGSLNLGGFASLVHGHDLSKPLYMKVEIALDGEQGDQRLAINAGESPESLDLSRLRLRYVAGDDETEWGPTPWTTVQSVGVGVEVRWSELLGRPYVSRHEVFFDGELLLAIVSPPDAGRAMLTDINFGHPLLETAGQEGDPGLEDLLRELSPENIADEQILGKSTAVRVPIRTSHGAFIDPSLPVALELNPQDNADAYYAQALSSIISEWLHGPSLIAVDLLKDMLYIGPLRAVPPREFRPQASPEPGRWASGLAAWDRLHEAGDGFIDQVNDWLAGEDTLNSGYALVRHRYREIAGDHPITLAIDSGLMLDQEGLAELLHALPLHTRIALRDMRTDLELCPQDIGVGISQVLPIVVAALEQRAGILAVEQPELHIHPALQVALGDLFASRLGDSDALYLLETHSEHLMLRLLRRIRETTDNELPPNVPELRPDQIAVYFVENSDSGVQMARIGIDEDGEFTDRWPRGFFPERREELF